VDGERDVLGLWAGEHGDGEGAKFWLRVLSEIKNRGTRDVLMVVCDGLKGLPDAVSAVWDKTIVQTCIVHLLRNSFKYASRKDWAQIAKDLKPVYIAASEAAALDQFAEFSGKWEKRYPAIIRLWENAWAEFVMLACPARRETSAGSMFQVNRAVVQNTCRRLCQTQMPVPSVSRHPAAR
jgi:putative transposase